MVKLRYKLQIENLIGFPYSVKPNKNLIELFTRFANGCINIVTTSLWKFQSFILGHIKSIHNHRVIKHLAQALNIVVNNLLEWHAARCWRRGRCSHQVGLTCKEFLKACRRLSGCGCG